ELVGFRRWVLFEESEAVLIAEPVIPDIEGLLVSLQKELPAASEAPTDVYLGNIVATCSHASADPFDSEIGGGQLYEVQDRPEAGCGPASDPGQVAGRSQGRFNGKRGGAEFGNVESTKELFG